MYALLSPAKKMSFDHHRTGVEATTLMFESQTQKLITILKDKSADDLSDLMHLSDKLAQLNYERYQSFEAAEQGRAIEAFQGDTYVGFAEKSLSDEDLTYAQNHVGILSGLYGLLRPLDLMKPYRLEMGTKLGVDGGKNLYQFWGDDITNTVNSLAGDTKAIINLASKEYISSINSSALNAPFITCDFKEIKDGKPKTIGLFAKRARGMMARYIVENRIEDVANLKKFSEAGYSFEKTISDETTLVFVR